MKPRPELDAGMPDRGFSHHVPFWWGSTLMITIEGAGLAILIVTYFYIRQTFNAWPPPRTPLPELGVSTLDVAVLVVSILPMWYVAQLAQKQGKSSLIGIGLLLCVLFGVVAAVLRILEFKGVHTRWDTNTYGAIVWSILAVHFAHIIAATLETLIIGILVLAGPVEGQHVRDISANAVYWYFVSLSWVALYTIVFLTPRFL
jgi:heme/copper-type cytochrome/quinol oxidase subunit 3